MDFLTTYEFVVSPMGRGPGWRRILLLIGYIAIGAGLVGIGLRTGLLAPMLVLALLIVWALAWLTWRFGKVEYEYSITAGSITFSKIWGGRNRKAVAVLELRDALYIKPADEAQGDLDRFEPDEKIDFSSRTVPADEPTVTYLLLWEEGRTKGDAMAPGSTFSESDESTCAHKTHSGRRHALLFEATEQALKLCRFYNPSTVIRKS